MRKRSSSLYSQLMAAFALLCLVATSLYSLYALAFAYTVEDKFFEVMLRDRAQLLLEKPPTWSDAARLDLGDGFSLYGDTSSLPDDLRSQIIKHPQRGEFFGLQGRYYHVLFLPEQRQYLVAEVSDRLIFRSMRSSALQILLYSALALFLGAMLSAWWLARRSAKPLEQLSEHVAQLFPLSHIKPQPVRTSAASKEIEQLSEAINRLLDRVFDDREQLREFAEREHRFTREVSHELRTPLAVMQLQLEALASNPKLHSANAEIASLQQACQHLQRLTACLLQLARAENQDSQGLVPMRSIQGIVESLIVDRATALDSKRQQVQLDFPNAQSNIAEPLLRIVLSNLLDNAIEHGKEGEAITLVAENARLRICNSADATRIAALSVDAFAQHDQSAGHGLGLSIVQRIANSLQLELKLQATVGELAVSFNLHGLRAVE